MRTKLKALHAEYHVYFQYVEVITVSLIHKLGEVKSNFY